MKNKILCFGLVLIFLAAMCGCNAEKSCVLENSDTADCSSSVSNTETSDETDTTVESEPEKATETVITTSEPISESNEPETAPTESKEPVEVEMTNIPAVPKAETTKTVEPSKVEETKSIESPMVTEEPDVTEPEMSDLPKQPSPTFNIDYWVKYAEDYAQGIGLKIDSSAADCWDAPISANSGSKYLERDIKNRLDRYLRDESVSQVLIWAEPDGGSSYLLYIGYS